MKRVILTSYQIGDVVHYDSNWMGVTPKEGVGTIVSIGKGYGTSGAQRPQLIFKIKDQNGRTLKLDEGAILGLEDIHE